MRFTTLFVLVLVNSALGLKYLHFSLDFFKIKDVRLICLLSCGDTYWDHTFTKYASNLSIAVSNVRIGGLSNNDNFGSVNVCLKHTFTPIGVYIDTKCALFEEVLLFASQNFYLGANHKWLMIHNDGRGHKKHLPEYVETGGNFSWLPDTFNVTLNEEISGNLSWHSESLNMREGVEGNEDLSWITDIFNVLELSIDADITLAFQKDDKYNIFEVYEVYKFGKGGDVIMDHLGDWNNLSDLAPKLAAYKLYRRWDFNQSSINLVAVMSTPPKEFDVDMIIGDKPKSGVAIITITGVQVFEELRKLHNIRYNYTILDRWIGDFRRNSSRVVANAIYFREQDISPLLRVTAEISPKLDMLLPPLTAIETRYYYRIPTTGAGKFENQFLRPLTAGAWGCVTAVISLCSLMLFISAKAERRPSAAQYAVFSVLATFCQQFFEDNCGNEDTRRESSDVMHNGFPSYFHGNVRTSLAISVSHSTKARQLALLVTGTSCVLIFNYYTSSVVSWLLNGPPPSINSLEELLESPLSLIFQDIGYTRSWLQNPTYYFNKKNADAEDKLRKYKVFNKKKGAALLVPLEEGIEMVKAGGYAYHTEVYNANTLISRTFTQEELCELGSLQSMEKTQLYAVVPKNSPYKEFFNWNLFRLHETGIISRIQHRTSNPEIACEGSSPRALALGGAAPAFLLLAFGFFLAAVILLMERLIARNKLGIINQFSS